MSIYDMLLANAMGESGGGGGGGSSDFSTAEVTIQVGLGLEVTVNMVNVDGEEMLTGAFFSTSSEPATTTYSAVLYKGVGYASIFDNATGDDYDMSRVSVTGDLTKDEYDIIITGNGTITIS